MAALEENLSKKTEKLVNKDLKEGKELPDFQEAQNHLLQLQAAQDQNLQVERAVAESRAQNNQTMAQAAEFMAASAGEGEQAQQLSPQTQAILSKYGYGKPGTRTSSNTKTSRGPVQGREVVINNKTENRTTNNINIASPAATITKSSGDNGMSKFKTWVTSSFAKQKEQDTIREREYDRKEWSLSRSTSKIMKSIEEIGKTMGERLDPRRLSSSMMDQMKLLFFLLGFQYIATNWKNIIRKAAKIEKAVRGVADFFGVDLSKDNIGYKKVKSEFSKTVIKLFGGDPERDSVGTALKRLLKDGYTYLMLKLKNGLKERGAAMSAVQFPKFSAEEGFIGMLKSVGVYLGDLLTALVSGKDGVIRSISHMVSSIGQTESMDENKPWARAKNRFSNVLNHSNLDYGDASALTANVMASYDYDSDGNLRNNLSSSIIQGNSIAGMINDGETDTINTAGVMTGLSKLSTSAKEKGFTLVSQEFVDSIKELTGGNLSKLPSMNYKFVVRKKEDKDYIDEGADPSSAASKAFAERSMKNMGKKAVGADGLYTKYLIDTEIEDPGYQAAKASGIAYLKRAGANENTLDLVPYNDPRPGVELEYYLNGKKKKGKFFKFYRLTPKDIQVIRYWIKKELNASDRFTFSPSDEYSMNTLTDKLKEIKLKKIAENKKKRSMNYEGVAYSTIEDVVKNNTKTDYDSVKEQFSKISDLNAQEIADRNQEENFYSDSSLGRAVNNAKEMYDSAVSSLSSSLHIPVVISNETRRNNVLEAMDYFINERGFSPEQAAGFVGNLDHESNGMNPHADNGSSSAYGLTQWIRSRRSDFTKVMKKPIQESSLRDQLEYIGYQLDHDSEYGTKTNELLKKAKTVEEASDIVFGNYELKGGVQSAIDQLNGNDGNMDGQKSRDDRIVRSLDAYETYMTFKYGRGKPIEKVKGNRIQKVNSKPKPVNLPKPTFNKSKTRAEKKKKKVFDYSPKKVPIPLKQKSTITNPWGASVDYYNQFKEIDNSSAGYLKDIVDGVNIQNKNIAMLSNSIKELTIVAASKGNVTNNIVNSGGGESNKTKDPSYTPYSNKDYPWNDIS